MKESFTHSLLVKKIYNELSENENHLLEAAMQNDWQLKIELENLEQAARKIDEARYYPSETSVNLILKYSRETAPVTTSC